jgi:DNA-binding response OmpR family regulator
MLGEIFAMGTTNGSHEKPRVLVVDESPIAVEAACLVLERDGFDVRPARTLAEVNAVLRSWTPNVVLTDVNMPGVTGPDLCRWIKVRLDHDGVAVVFFSDLPETVLEVVARAAGADDYLSKSRGPRALACKLQNVFEAMPRAKVSVA